MIAAFQRRPLAFSLAVVAVVLAGVIALELGMGAGLRSALAPADKRGVATEAKLLPPVVAMAPEQAYPETTARPLFLPTRRPAPAAPTEDKRTFVQGQFVLQGVTIAGNTRIALLREKSNGRIHRVERGKEVNGVQVVEIQPEVVTLGLGGEREVLSLQVQRPAGAPPAAAQAGPFAGPAVAGVSPVGGQPAAAPGQPTPPAQQPPTAGPRPGAAQPAPQPLPPNLMARDPPPTAAPMSPEELLARRRARRNQQTQ